MTRIFRPDGPTLDVERFYTSDAGMEVQGVRGIGARGFIGQAVPTYGSDGEVEGTLIYVPGVNPKAVVRGGVIPRFRVRERRIRTVEYLIDAKDAEAAGRLDGTIIEEADVIRCAVLAKSGAAILRWSCDTGLELLDVEEVDVESL